MSRKAIYILTPILLLVVLYFVGPTPKRNVWSTDPVSVPQSSAELEAYIKANDARHQVKPDNEARIVWYDSTKTKTPYSVIYLHGFSASQEEGDPVHQDFAKKFGCNLYLSRLADHGVDTTDQLLYFSGDRFWESSKEALAIGKAIGEKVIVMGTSTGGTMGLILAATFPADVHALINLSPNCGINHPLAGVSNNPWGLQVTRMVLGGDYSDDGSLDPKRWPYWNKRYRAEAVPALQQILEESMTEETYRKVTCPSLTLYYYKNEKEQDPTVKVSAILEMNRMLSTPGELKVEQAIPGAGSHVIGCYLTSGDVQSVQRAAAAFAENQLKLTPVSASQTP